jgi:hypothetical protein
LTQFKIATPLVALFTQQSLQTLRSVANAGDVCLEDSNANAIRKEHMLDK